MAGTLIQLDVRTREEWRRWLAKHHASSPGIWLLRHKQHTGVTSMSYEDLVREALCFGWVDSLIKRLDENLYAIKVTPRQPTLRGRGSRRSPTNVTRPRACSDVKRKISKDSPGGMPCAASLSRWF